MSLFTKSSDKEKKKNKKVLLLNKEKGDEDCILNDKGTENLL